MISGIFQRTRITSKCCSWVYVAHPEGIRGLARIPRLGTRGAPGGYPGSHSDPSPGDVWRTRRASGGSPGSLIRGHVVYPEGIRGSPGSFTRLKYCSSEQVLL